MSTHPIAASPKQVSSVCSRLSTLHGPAIITGFLGSSPVMAFPYPNRKVTNYAGQSASAPPTAAATTETTRAAPERHRRTFLPAASPDNAMNRPKAEPVERPEIIRHRTNPAARLHLDAGVPFAPYGKYAACSALPPTMRTAPKESSRVLSDTGAVHLQLFITPYNIAANLCQFHHPSCEGGSC